MPVRLPDDPVEFHALLRRRIRDQDAIDGFRAAAKVQRALPVTKTQETSPLSFQTVHTVGQTGCFCLDCLLHRKQEWRIGDINTTVAGPRDCWRQYTWGNAERQALGAVISRQVAVVEPIVTPTVREKVVVHDVKQRQLCIERDAKFTAVVSGKYHTLMLSESGAVFACGDNSYGALGVETKTVRDSATMIQVELPTSAGHVDMIAASAHASFALITLPPSLTAKPAHRSEDTRGEQRPGLVRRRLIEDALGRVKQQGAVTYNYLVSWGRGERGVLGNGGLATTWTPTIIDTFNTMQVLQVSAGASHVLVLTERDGVFAFGDGSDGKLGLGDSEDRLSPCHVPALNGLNIIHVGAGNAHSVAVTGDSTSTRQVYSWGCGENGRLGHGDVQPRLKPTRVSHFRGRKVITVSVGGAHNLATSEMPDGVCVWSWGAGAYGQLGHRETWDGWVPRSIDEIRRESIRFIDAGERHSVAISDSRQLWIWGKGVHGKPDVEKLCPSTTCQVHPVKVNVPGLELVSARAGRDRTFVWGDRAVDRVLETRSFGGSAASSVCVALPEFQSLTSDCFRTLYRCGGCHLDDVCIACAHRCHVTHCLELSWTLESTLSRECACFSSGKCLFDLEGGIDEQTNEI